VVRNAEGAGGVGDGIRSPGDYSTGGYVRVCRPDGSEWIAWHHSEWRARPVSIMAEIILALKDHLPVVSEGKAP
jgi:hypothetical protein